METNYVEVDGQKFVDDGQGSPKLGEDGQPIPFVEEQKVPYSRFKEVNDKVGKLEQEISSLKTQKAGGGLTPEQDKELKAKEALQKFIDEGLEKREKARQEQEANEQRQFEDEVNEVLANNTDIKKPDFLDFIEKKSEKFGITTVKGALELYRHLDTVKKEGYEEAFKKPGMPSHEGGVERIEPKPEDKGKSFSQITNEVQNELRKGR